MPDQVLIDLVGENSHNLNKKPLNIHGSTDFPRCTCSPLTLVYITLHVAWDLSILMEMRCYLSRQNNNNY